ncbi:ABC transporter permease [uncultured Robinsoniella sp.]|uniref:ABC transporter permease n=1 Tax=uncultured Robinsoniella sp. TaxID=904190 RepID=UPI00374EDADF
MNIFHKVALQGLKKNRTRTFVTIIGVALSAALITAVASFAVSLQTYMINGAIVKYGGWHVAFPNSDSSFVQEQVKDSRVTNAAAFENVGYAELTGGQNPDKPYLFIAGFHKDTFDTLPLELLSGRLPENSNEIVAPAHISSNGGVKIAVGDTLTLAVGNRKAGNETLSQNDPYRAGEEALASPSEKTYKVVGICQRPSFEERSAPGYTMITTADSMEAASSLSVFVSLKNPSRVRMYAENAAGGRAYFLNDEVLRFMGVSDDTIFNTLLYSIGSVLVILIMMGSVFLIYNSFNISLNERTHQFGILMSVGATEKQLQNSVLFEGLCIGVIGIPLGMLIGIPSMKLVLALVAKNFSNVFYDNVPLTLKVSVPALAAAVLISIITILISAYIPAKKAARIPVMECIRQTNEIKVQAKAIKTSKLTRRIYGLEETLALKNFKRNKRRYRSIILSLTLSVVLFVSASAFRTDLNQVAEKAKVVTDYDIGLSTPDMDDREMTELYDKMKNVEGVLGSTRQIVMNYICTAAAGGLSEAYLNTSGEHVTEETINLPMEIQFLDDSTYLGIINQLGLPAEQYEGENAKLIAVAKLNDDAGQAESVSQLKDLFRDSSASITVIPEVNGEPVMDRGQNINITCVDYVPPDNPPYTGKTRQLPYSFQVMAPLSLMEKLVPADTHADIKVRGFTFRSENPSSDTKKMQSVIEGSGITTTYTLYNVHAMTDLNRNILFIVNLFTVVFILMISLIAVANVFNTIATNIRLRRRELAMLRSVGMSDCDFNKMMRFECILYGAKTLLFGLPISGIMSWMIYKGMQFGSADIGFVFPWSSIIISMLGVFCVIFITMLYVTSKIRKENIIDALRDDMA